VELARNKICKEIVLQFASKFFRTVNDVNECSELMN